MNPTPRRSRRELKVFVAGVVIGGLLGGLLGGAMAAEIIVNHPHFASRLRAALLPGGPPASSPTIAPGSLSDVTVRVDASAAGHAISPYIYGVSIADPDVLKALGATVDRWGGNPSTRYNWAYGNAWNAARDWDFHNTNYGNPSGSVSDNFVRDAVASGSVPLITIPSIGWVAKNGDSSTQSVQVPSQGGPPLSPGSSSIAGYDPTANRQLTSVPSYAKKPSAFTLDPSPTEAAVYQDEWVHELVQRFGVAPRGVGYFAIDNEPDLWSTTQTDVHPTRMSYDSMLANYEEYATAVKAQDPTALILGPDASGWTSYYYSDLDRGNDNFATHADQNAHGGQPFLPWWLGQVAKADQARGSRSLDLLDVHFYPQAQGVFSDASDPATQALRIRSVHALFDPKYVDESWIATPVDLIPRLKQWIAQEYPGTGLAITEYNWGGEKDASGAVALAEVLGTFGREGVSLATYWSYPQPASPAGAAFRLYRNFDGHGASFGNVSLPVSSSANGVAAYAARHSERRETDVILVNEAGNQTAHVHLDLGVASYGTATLFRVAGGSSDIVKSSLASASDSLTLPPYSLTLVRVAQS